MDNSRNNPTEEQLIEQTLKATGRKCLNPHDLRLENIVITDQGAQHVNVELLGMMLYEGVFAFDYPLSDDILLSCGFEKHPNHDHVFKRPAHTYFDFNDREKQGYIRLKRICPNTYRVDNLLMKTIVVRSVHQIQNVFHFMTQGKELDICAEDL